MEKCQHFQRGSCKFGTRCKKSHEGGSSSSVDKWGKTDSKPTKSFSSKDKERGGEVGGEYNADDTVRIWCRPNAKSFVNSMQMKRFIKACSESVQKNNNELLDNICGGDRTGLDRITEICQCDFQVDAGTDFQKYSFQQIIVGMLKLVMDPKLSNSVLRRLVNTIINVIQENLDLEEVEKCLEVMENRQSIEDRQMMMMRFGQENFWSPKSWDELLLPISGYCEKVIPQTQAQQASPQMLKLISRLKSITDNINGVGKIFKDQVKYLQNEYSVGIDPQRQIHPDLAQKLLTVVDVEDNFNQDQPLFFDGLPFCSQIDYYILKAFHQLRTKMYYQNFYQAFFEPFILSLSREQEDLILGGCDIYTSSKYEHKALVKDWIKVPGAIYQIQLKIIQQVDKKVAQQCLVHLLKGIDIEIGDETIHVQSGVALSLRFKHLKIIRLQNFGRKHFNVDFGEWFFENILKQLPGFEDSKLVRVFIMWDLGYRHKNERHADFDSIFLMVSNVAKEMRESTQVFEKEFVQDRILNITCMSVEQAQLLLQRYIEYLQWPDLVTTKNLNIDNQQCSQQKIAQLQ